jgi:hypothetical protein
MAGDKIEVARTLLTPKIGTGKGLTCGPSLVKKHHSAGNFPQRIRQRCLRSVVRHHSAEGLFALEKRKLSGIRDDVARI